MKFTKEECSVTQGTKQELNTLKEYQNNREQDREAQNTFASFPEPKQVRLKSI